MEKMFRFIAVPLGFILNWIYENIAFHNYALAMIIFTVVVKSALLPITIKQQKQTRKMQELQPKLNELRKKYKNDPQKLNMETMKLYQENNLDMGGGCFTALLQMPILLSLFYVVSKPLTYMKQFSVSEIANLVKQFNIDGKMHYKEIFIVAHTKMLNMDLFGINLASIPSLRNVYTSVFVDGNIKDLVVIMLPILAIVATYLSSRLSMKKLDKMNKENSEKAASGATGFMLYSGVVFTAMLVFTLPAGMSLYWIVSNLYMILQQLYIDKYVIVTD